jgi:long-chain acyl-CoA synthetase
MGNVWDQRLGFWWIAEDHPDAPAILYSPDGPRTFAELAGDAHQLVHLFRSLGVVAGDAVGLLVDNGNAIIEASLACQEAGFLFIPLNTHLTTSELEMILEHSDAKVLIIGERYAHLLEGVDRRSVAVLSVGAIDGVTSLAEARVPHPRSEPSDRSPGGLFVYTSGTTGKPKGIRRPIPEGDVGQVANDSALFGRAFDFRPMDGPMLVSTGMFHGGSHSYYMGGLHVGHALVIMAKFDPEETLRLIEQFHIRTGYMVPTQFHRLMKLPEEVRARYDVSSLHSIVHSAAPCPRPLKEALMAWWGPVVWETYGGMEGAATIAKPQRWLEKPGTVGRAIRGVRLFILDDDGNELPAGTIGTVWMKMGDRTFEYHGDPEKTKKSWNEKGFFTVGDAGELDEDGFLFLRDRKIDMIISGGVNIYPAETESVLLQHPKVNDAAVYGIPHEDLGEAIHATVQLVEGVEAGPDVEAELIAFCTDNLAKYKVPRSIDFRQDFPRTETGKLLKRQLRDPFWADKDSQLV